MSGCRFLCHASFGEAVSAQWRGCIALTRVDEKAIFSRSAPTREEFIGLLQFLNDQPGNSVYATSALGQAYPSARLFTDRAAGLLAIPLSRMARDYIVFFRREVAGSVMWASNPDKPVTVGPWVEPELRVAESLRITLLEFGRVPGGSRIHPGLPAMRVQILVELQEAARAVWRGRRKRAG